ncbi:ABC transporter permease [Proteinivorax tanatarense]|uniref:ABC transporter permease n=1 Tax=Proteinivorax tanatarense TaxID=1260629 RepID=A0AAU7VKY0_9FIRM
MKSINVLAFRYLWQQKKRTALTVLGIIISMAMLTSMGTVLVSYRDTLIQEVKEKKALIMVFFQV